MPASLEHKERMLKHLEHTEMATPVSRTTDDDDLILRFLSAAEARVDSHNGRVPLNKRDAIMAISWMRGLVGKINENGTLQS